MASYGECRRIEVDAPPRACFDALTDVELLPSWQRAVCDVEVLERDAEGRAAVVAYEVDARVRRVRYRLRQRYDPPTVVRSEYLGGDFRDFTGEWRFVALDDGRTRVELDLRIDPGRLVPRPLRALISDAVMARALRDLKDHVERSRPVAASP
jgi:ribosome-associated toxin RatA of RatAB toxin-antitoxin module